MRNYKIVKEKFIVYNLKPSNLPILFVEFVSGMWIFIRLREIWYCKYTRNEYDMRKYKKHSKLSTHLLVLTFNEGTFAKLRKNPLFTDHYATGSTIQVNRTIPKSQTNEPKARCAKNQTNHDARLQRSRSSRTEIPVNVQIVVNPKFPLTVLLIKITWCRRVAIPWSVAAKANIRV